MMSVIQHIQNIFFIDKSTIAVMAGLCSITCWFLKEYLAIPPLIILVHPVILFLCMIAKYVIISLEIYPPSKLDLWLMWTVLAAIIGNIVAILLLAGAALMREARVRASAEA